MDETNQLPTHLECPQCNTRLRPFMVQSQNPNIDVELDRCHGCGGVWFDAGELEISTGRKVVPTRTPVKDRYCPRCLIPLLSAELTGRVAVEACRSCKGVYLDSRDMHIVTRQAPAKPPEKRLTRLEQLRLEQEEREKAAPPPPKKDEPKKEEPKKQ